MKLRLCFSLMLFSLLMCVLTTQSMANDPDCPGPECPDPLYLDSYCFIEGLSCPGPGCPGPDILAELGSEVTADEAWDYLQDYKAKNQRERCPGAGCPDKIEYIDPALDFITVEEATETLRNYQKAKQQVQGTIERVDNEYFIMHDCPGPGCPEPSYQSPDCFDEDLPCPGSGCPVYEEWWEVLPCPDKADFKAFLDSTQNPTKNKKNLPCPGAGCPDRFDFPDSALNDMTLEEINEAFRQYKQENIK